MLTPPLSHRALRVLFMSVLWMSLLLSSVSASLPAQANDSAITGEWGAVIQWGIMGKTLVPLHNNKLLAFNTGDHAFVWDPATGTKVAVPTTFGDIHCSAQATLADGRVIIVGGVDGPPHTGISLATLFDPATNTWTKAMSMTYERWYGTATTLPDGRVLATSGDRPDGTRANIPEVYDPLANTWTLLPGAERDVGLYPEMFVLPNGKVYNAGTKSSTAILDLNAGAWSNGPPNSFGSSGYAEAAATYAPGKIIRTGGGDPAIADAAVIDMNVAAPSWRKVAAMNIPRRRHNLVILADGQIMAVGGAGQGDDQSAAVYVGEIWNPATEQWTLTAPMTYDRMYHSAAALLPDGRVIVSGGEYDGRLTAQLFSPPYLFKGQRPTISAAPATVSYGSSFSVGVTTDGSSIVGVSMIRPSATTHASDQNQRYVPLSFIQSGNTLTVSAPTNGNMAPPGYYMLIVKDSKGAPSVAAWVRVGGTANTTPGAISGKVTDSATNTAISGATVAYSGGTTTTNASGAYTLTHVPPGQQTVTVSKTGYATTSKSQTVTSGATATLNFALTQPGAITGKVTDSQNGAPIAEATITYSGGATLTDTNGNYTIANISSGDQTLAAAANGYTSSAPRVVDVPANGVATADFALTPTPSYIIGEVRDSVTNDVIPGATVAAGTVLSATDALGRYQMLMPPGVYTVTASMDGYINADRLGVVVTRGLNTSVDFSLTAVNPPHIFTTNADAYTKQSKPNINFGDQPALQLDSGGTAGMNSYLRFAVQGLQRPVQSAKIRLYVTTASNQGGAIYAVANTLKNSATPWEEDDANGVTWNNAPPIAGQPLSSAGAVTANTWIEFDVTAVITGDGTYSFGLKTTSTKLVAYSSKEGGNPPQLIIRLEPPPPPPPPPAPVIWRMYLPLIAYTDVSAATGPSPSQARGPRQAAAPD